MKLIPKNLFKSKKTRFLSRSENTSFGSVTTTSSTDSIDNGISTPTSVLPKISSELIHAVQLGADTKKQKEELSGNTLTNMLPDKIPLELIHAYQMIGANTKIQKEELSGILPDKIPSELIQAYQMIGAANRKIQELSGNMPTDILPDKIPSKLIQAYEMIGANAKIQMEELSGNTPTGVLPNKIPSELIQAFHMIGTDSKIQKDELSGNTEIPSEVIHVFQMIGANTSTSVLPEIPSELELLLVNGDGCISLQELRDTFDFFDVNHDGKITAEELLNVFTTIGDERCTLEDCRRMIRGVDKNEDGFVCFEDFCIMMEQQR